MELQQLHAFLAIAEELHFGRAAQRLHIAQPPLSRKVRQLERALGASLFERDTRNVRLTAAGEALVVPARNAVEAGRLAELAVHAASQGLRGRVRIGFAGASSHRHIGPWVRMVRQRYPDIECELFSSPFAGEALDKLNDRSLDIAMVRLRSAPEGVETKIIAWDGLRVALPRSHALAKRKRIRLPELLDTPWVTLPAEPGSVLRETLLRLSADEGYTPRIIQSAPDSWSVVALVAAEVGAALTLESIADTVADPGVAFVRLQGDPAPLELRLAWRMNDPNPAAQSVLALADAVLPLPPPPGL